MKSGLSLILEVATITPLWGFQAKSRGNGYIETRFGTREGLDSQIVNAIVQPRNGMLWVGPRASTRSMGARLIGPRWQRFCRPPKMRRETCGREPAAEPRNSAELFLADGRWIDPRCFTSTRTGIKFTACWLRMTERSGLGSVSDASEIVDIFSLRRGSSLRGAPWAGLYGHQRR